MSDVPPEDPPDDQPPDAQPPDDQPSDDQPSDDQPSDDQPPDAQPSDDQPSDDPPPDDQPPAAPPPETLRSEHEPIVIDLTFGDDHERPGGLLSKVAQNMVMYHDSDSVLAEQYRQCRTNITALNRTGAPWVLVVTSSRKGEGKSVTVANMAVSLAELPGTRVCLLDADSRSPQVAGLFGLEPAFGLTEHLRDGVPLEEVLNMTLIDNLDCVGAGGQAKNPAELLGTERFRNLIEELRRRYSWILIDTPPVNPFTDAAVVSALANGTLLVVRLKETPRSLVNSTIDALTIAGGKVIGTLITGTTPDDKDAAAATLYREEARSPEKSSESASAARARRRAESALLKKEKSVLRKRGRAARSSDEEDYPV